MLLLLKLLKPPRLVQVLMMWVDGWLMGVGFGWHFGFGDDKGRRWHFVTVNIRSTRYSIQLRGVVRIRWSSVFTYRST